MTAFRPGDTLGRYRVERLLGRGAMGEVYLARDPQIDRPLAIKTLRVLGVRPEEMAERKERMLREARAAGRLIHPHIVTLFDAGEQDGVLFLAFEYVAGSDLAARLRSAPLPLGQALRVVREVCHGLDHAHRQGIVHRDVKPSNLMLAGDGRVKIADFGIAKLSGEASELTVTGTVMGSPHYMAPEQVRGEALDGRSDLYSLGVVLYEMLTRRRPFDGDTLTTLVYQILSSEPAPLADLRPGLAPRLPALLGLLMAKDRDARPADAAAVVAAVEDLESELPAELLAEPAVPVDGSTDATVVMEESGPSAAAGEAAAAPDGHGPAAPPAPPAATVPPAAVPPPPPPRGDGEVSARDRTASATGGTYAAPSLGAAGGNLRRWLLAAGAAVVVLAAVLGLLALLGPGDGSGVGGGGDAGGEQEAGASMETTAGGVDDAPGTGRGEAVDGAVAGTAGGASTARPADGGGAGATEPSGGSGAVADGGAAVGPSSRQPGTPANATERGDAEEATGKAGGSPELKGPTVSGAVAGGEGTARPGPGPTAEPTGSAPSPSPGGEAGDRPSRAEPVGGAANAADPTDAAASPPPAADRTVRTGMGLVFEVRPPDAFVLVDGTVIGRVDEYGRDSGRPYTLPSPGAHRVTLRRDGMQDLHLRVEASPSGPAVTPLRARMEPLPAEEIPRHELETHRVREAVALRVVPPTARLLVDGEPRGVARRYSGGRFGRGEWLQLSPGFHRLSLIAPGHRRVDLLVDVTSGADRERERIRVVLPPLPEAAP